MNGNDLNQAKEMFWQFACMHFYMWNDGVIEDYKKYGASPAQEEIWRQEYIAHWTKLLSVDDLTALNKLCDARAGESLLDLIERSKGGDHYSKLMYANAIWNLAGEDRCPNEYSKRGKDAALALWKELSSATIQMTPEHQYKVRCQATMWSREAKTPEECIQHLAQKQIAQHGLINS